MATTKEQRLHLDGAASGESCLMTQAVIKTAGGGAAGRGDDRNCRSPTSGMTDETDRRIGTLGVLMGISRTVATPGIRVRGSMTECAGIQIGLQIGTVTDHTAGQTLGCVGRTRRCLGTGAVICRQIPVRRIMVSRHRLILSAMTEGAVETTGSSPQGGGNGGVYGIIDTPGRMTIEAGAAVRGVGAGMTEETEASPVGRMRRQMAASTLVGVKIGSMTDPAINELVNIVGSDRRRRQFC